MFFAKITICLHIIRLLADVPEKNIPLPFVISKLILTFAVRNI